jgi:hypothetical protein
VNSLGHFLIGYNIILIVTLIINRYLPENLKYWSFAEYFQIHHFFAIVGGIIASFPDYSEIFGFSDTDTETWSNIYFYHYSIDAYYHTISPNVRMVFEVVPVIIFLMLAFLLNYYAYRKIICHRVKTNEIGKEVCKMANEYVGSIGSVIVNDICIDRGYSLENISKNDLIILSDSIGEALGSFTGRVMAKEIQDEMNKIDPIPVYNNTNNGENINYYHEIEFSDIDFSADGMSDLYR